MSVELQKEPTSSENVLGALKYLRYAVTNPERVSNPDLAAVLRRIRVEKEKYLTVQNERNRRVLDKLFNKATWATALSMGSLTAGATFVSEILAALHFSPEAVLMVQQFAMATGASYALIMIDFILLYLLKPAISWTQFYVRNGKTINDMTSWAEKQQRHPRKFGKEIASNDLLPVPPGTVLEAGKVYNTHFQTGSEIQVTLVENGKRFINRYLVSPPGIFSLGSDKYLFTANRATVLNTTLDKTEQLDRDAQIPPESMFWFAVRSDGKDNRLIVGDNPSLKVEVGKPDSRIVAVFNEKTAKGKPLEFGGSTDEVLVIFQPTKSVIADKKRKITFTGVITISDPYEYLESQKITFNINKDGSIELNTYNIPPKLEAGITYNDKAARFSSLKNTVARDLKVTNLGGRMLVRCPQALVKVTGQFS